MSYCQECKLEIGLCLLKLWDGPGMVCIPPMSGSFEFTTIHEWCVIKVRGHLV